MLKTTDQGLFLLEKQYQQNIIKKLNNVKTWNTCSTLLWLSQGRTWIPYVICRGLFHVQLVVLKCVCSFVVIVGIVYDYCLDFSFHKNYMFYPLAFVFSYKQHCNNNKRLLNIVAMHLSLWFPSGFFL